MTENLYTTSRLKVLRQCLRLHYFRYTLGIQTASSSVAYFGTVAHSALEAWLRAWQIGADRLAAAMAALAIMGDAYERAKLRALIIAYDARWGAEEWEVLAVEVEFRYRLNGKHLVGGKIDAIIRNRIDGRIWVLEHKTTGQDTSVGSAYWERLSIDTQVSIYLDGASALGYEVAGVIYDVLQRPRHERKLATPEADRQYTIGKGCKECGGSAKPGAVEKGRGYKVITFTTVEHVPCEQCDGTGWKKDKDGKPEAPRLHKDQRLADESVDDFAQRVGADVVERINDYLMRGEVVRSEDETERMRTDLLDTIKSEQVLSAMFDGLPPRNPDACNRFGSLCSMFAQCSGRADINDHYQFPRGATHPELADAA